MAAKAALALVFRERGLTRVAFAQQLGTDEQAVGRLLDPRHGTDASRINSALRVLGRELGGRSAGGRATAGSLGLAPRRDAALPLPGGHSSGEW